MGSWEKFPKRSLGLKVFAKHRVIWENVHFFLPESLIDLSCRETIKKHITHIICVFLSFVFLNYFSPLYSLNHISPLQQKKCLWQTKNIIINWKKHKQHGIWWKEGKKKYISGHKKSGNRIRRLSIFYGAKGLKIAQCVEICIWMLRSDRVGFKSPFLHFFCDVP